MKDERSKASELVFYRSEDGRTKLQVRFEGKTVWLTQGQMAELFQTTKQNVSLHLKNIFGDKELDKDSAVKGSLTTASDGKQYETQFYNLDAIISIGYRVKSHRGTQFRIWATQKLKEYLVKGFALDDERLKRAGGGDYFEELLERIRDIRSSEKVFWRKVLDIYATSVDYDPNEEVSQKFFATVQNKMHWAAHGHTAAEIIVARADASLPHMGLTSWIGDKPRKSDVAIAKNYLNAEEIDALNRIVTAYLEFAELQAKGRRPMYMRDWVAKLDDFLRLSDQEILSHAGKVSHEVAVAKAEQEYELFHAVQIEAPSDVEKDFEIAVEKLKLLKPGKPDRALKKEGKEPK